MLQCRPEVRSMAEATIEVRFTVPVGDVSEKERAEAERKAREAFVLALLRQGSISAGRAAELLGVDRWQLGDLMSAHGISPFDETLSREELARETGGTAHVG
jgi:predicted HTH domain antitoxin